MQNISNVKKCMASLAVFRNLYENNKDIYYVISEFAAQIIVTNGIHGTCDLSDIMGKMREEYGFEVPSSVLKNALKKLKFVNIEKTRVIINDTEFPNPSDTLKEYEKHKQNNDSLLNKFVSFVEESEKRKIDEIEKETITTDFCKYIVDETITSKYGSYILTFIVNHKEDQEIKDQISLIRDGAISFVGLSFQTNDNSIDVLDEHLTIYLDTEILFHMAGYNGPILKKMFDEFYELVQSANKKYHNKKGKNIISLKYLDQTSDEVNYYFKSAEEIIRKKGVIDKSKHAMTAITSGCIYAFEINEKKAAFEKLLTEKNIVRETYTSIYDESKYPLVIEQSKFIEENIDNKKIQESLDLLQNVRTRRGQRDQKRFRSIGFILLTGKQLTNKIALDPAIREVKDVPLATTLSFLTNRFWFSLNKGLGNMNLISFDVIAKTQLALSSLISDKVGREFDRINKDVQDGKLDTDTATKKLAALQQHLVNSEDIEPDNNTNDGYLSFLNTNDIDNYIANENLEKEKLKKEIKDSQLQIELQNKDISQKDDTIKMMVKNKLQELNNKEEEEYKRNIEIYNDKKAQYIALKYKETKKRMGKYVFFYICVLILLFLISKALTSFCKFELPKFIIVLFEIIIFCSPFILPMVEKRIKNAILFFFRPKNKNQYKKEFEKEFDQAEKQPIKKQYTYEDAYKIMINKP